jgi:hypothetical protein
MLSRRYACIWAGYSLAFRACFNYNTQARPTWDQRRDLFGWYAGFSRRRDYDGFDVCCKPHIWEQLVSEAMGRRSGTPSGLGDGGRWARFYGGLFVGSNHPEVWPHAHSRLEYSSRKAKDTIFSDKKTRFTRWFARQPRCQDNKWCPYPQQQPGIIYFRYPSYCTLNDE